MPSVTIEGVPLSITRADYTKLLESIGLDPARLRSLTFGHSHIRAEVIAEDPERIAAGKSFPATAAVEGNDFLIHDIVIPVVD